MADGYAVRLAALRETAQGINDSISGLSGLGFDEAGEEGRGFSMLALSGLDAGTAAVGQCLGEFCDRWSWGVRSLVQDANQFAQRLGLNAGVYADNEDFVTGVVKDAADALAGDPHMSDAQAAQASWSQDGAEVTGAQTPGGDMTPQQGVAAVSAQWKAVGRDAANDPLGIAGLAGGG